MLNPVRVMFRALTSEGEEGTGHVQRVCLPRAGRLRSIYARGHGLLPGEDPGALYRVRVYAGNPVSSCWHLELTASSIGDDARTPDVLHQGLEVHLPDTFWVTYQLLNASAGAQSLLHVELLVES